MATATHPGKPTRGGLRPAVAVVGCLVAAAGALAGSDLALNSLEWGSDSGPLLVVVAVVPAAVSAAAVGVVTSSGVGTTRPAVGPVATVVGLLMWLVALVAAFQSQSPYSSTTNDTRVSDFWVVLGALGALAAVGGGGLAGAQARSRRLVLAAGLVVAAWLVFGVARGVDPTAVLPIGSAGPAATGVTAAG